MRQNLIIIGDTHFGARNNSMVWLKHQEEGFMEIIDTVEKSVDEYDRTLVVHVGDLFDSRSSINPLVYRTVERLMVHMSCALGHHPEHHGSMYIVGGNHDYYYQWESENNYSSTLMLPYFDHITYVNKEPIILPDRDMVMIPWFSFHNKESLRSIMDRCLPDTIIFTHTDPIHLDPALKSLIQGHPLITGHIHQPLNDWGHKLLITGASFPMDFTDTNSDRGFWMLDRESDMLTFHAVDSSIHFFTLTEHTLRSWHDMDIRKDDYVEVQIRASHVDDYKEVLKELTENFNTTVMYLTETSDIITEASEVMNVDTVCRHLLPDKLKDLYRKMVEACKEGI